MNASELIDNRITELGGWRGQMLARLRKLILEAAPDLVEEWKWDTPIWASNGDVLAVGAFQDHIKINFFHGALLEDHRLFNAGLEAQKSRGIDIHENDTIAEAALKELIRAAVSLNSLKRKAVKSQKKPATRNTRQAGPSKAPKSDLPKLSAPAQRALDGAGIKNLKQLSKFSEPQIKELHGIGPNAIAELRRALKRASLAFAKK